MKIYLCLTDNIVEDNNYVSFLKGELYPARLKDENDNFFIEDNIKWALFDEENNLIGFTEDEFLEFFTPFSYKRFSLGR